VGKEKLRKKYIRKEEEIKENNSLNAKKEEISK
jgi:hypothetical protein